MQGSAQRDVHQGQPTTRAGRRGWIGLAVTALPCMLYSMDLTVLNLAIPSLNAIMAVGVAILAAFMLPGAPAHAGSAGPGKIPADAGDISKCG